MNDAAVTEAGGLHPLQHDGSAAAVVAGKPGIPEKGQHRCHDDVDQEGALHGCASARKSYVYRGESRKRRKVKKMGGYLRQGR
jgi:hypothetical protein